MDGLIGSYLLSSKTDDDSWDWTDSDDWEDGPEAVRAVHFHTAEVSEEELASLLALPNLEAIAFCEDHDHTDASLGRIAQLMEQKGIVDVEFEKSEHVPWLAHLPRAERVRFPSFSFDMTDEVWASIAGAAGLRELFLNSVGIDDEGVKHVAGLTGLRRLVLDGNDELTDLAPLAALTELESLSLAGTDVKDLTPLAKLTGLKRLDLSHGEARELAPLAGLTALEDLDLEELKIADGELAHLAGATRLKRLNLCRCPIGDAGLAHLSGLNIEELRLTGTRVSGERLRELRPNGWPGMFDEDAQVATERASDGDDWDWKPVTAWEGDPATLRAIRLRDTWVDTGGFDFLVYTTGLEHFDVTGMTLGVQDLERVGALSRLRELRLGNVDLEDPALDDDDDDDDDDDEEPEEPELDDARVTKLLAGLPDLEVLDLALASLTGASADAITSLKKLRRLGLERVDEAAPAMLEALKQLPLEALDLTGCTIDDDAMSGLAGLALRAVRLGHNPITAAGLAKLSTDRLEALGLEGTQVADLGSLRGLESLRKLDLEGAPITDGGVAEVLPTLTGLVELDLTATEAGDAVAAAAAALPALKTLKLRKTQVTDAAIPALCGSGLKSLDLQAVWLSEASKEALEAAPFDVELSRPDDEDEPRQPFAGLEQARFTGKLPEAAAKHAWRISVPSYDAEFPLEVFMRRFLDDPRVGEVEALVIGSWEEPYEGPPERALELLVEHADRLPKLRAFYLGDMDSEECEISWIQHGDLSPILAAFPNLTELKIRGAVGLQFSQPLALPSLKRLTIECGGLPPSVLRAIGTAQLPALEALQLYLGTEDYGWEEEGLALLTPILSGKLFPKLGWLGLQDSEQADAVAALVASAPVIEQLEVLDLSLGTLGDEGAQALLASPAVARLKRLDLHHHYMSDAMAKRLEGLGPEVDVSAQQEPDDWGDGELHRYVAVGE